MRRGRNQTAIALVVLMLLASLNLVGCREADKDSEGSQDKSYQVTLKTDKTNPSQFASYQETAVDVKPILKPYQVAPDLSNIINQDRFRLSPEAKNLMVKNGFVVVPGSSPEFYVMYEPNRYDGLPNFVTTDAMLHNYHLFFSFLLREVEQKQLIPELKTLNASMLADASKQYYSLQGTAWENAARRNLAFFSTGSYLLDPQVKIPSPVAREVNRELALINAHQGITASPVMNMGNGSDAASSIKEDYSQYIPRSHYTRSEELKRYFKSMMWYGRMNFRIKDEDTLRSAVLITLALNQGDNLKHWNNIYEPTNFFVGKSDDLGYYQLMPLLQKVYGKSLDLRQLPNNNTGWSNFTKQAQKLTPPSINSLPILDAERSNRDEQIIGFRFMGQRFTLDASVFQQLVYRKVKENPQGQRRMLPKGLDIPAAMGSVRAEQLLKGMKETNYEKYPQNMKELKTGIAELDQKTWTQNLYWSWLYNLLPLTQEKPAGYPSFMRNQAWTNKELSTYLSSWTELKHDTILYAKPCYAEAGGGDPAQDDRGYVEPNPVLYARLASLAAMTRDGLSSRGLLSSRDRDSLDRLEKLSRSLKTISEKELKNTPLTDQEYELIRGFGADLEHLWMEALRYDSEQGRPNLYDNPSALVADVANDPNGSVLEEATGYVFEIYAVVPIDGKLRIAKGGVYSYYEFTWPLEGRLTDQQWWQMLKDDKTPPSPEWAKTFTAPAPKKGYQ